MPPNEPDQPNYTTVQIQALRLQAHAERNKEVRKLALDKPKFFAAILQRTSVASRLLIEADGGWTAAKAASDPNALITIMCPSFLAERCNGRCRWGDCLRV